MFYDSDSKIGKGSFHSCSLIVPDNASNRGNCALFCLINDYLFNTNSNRYCFYPKNYIFAPSINQILQPCLTLQQE